MSNSIQQIFSFFKEDFLKLPDLSWQQIKVLNHITACRTPNMGGFLSSCPDCGTYTPLFHSCSDRHCPVCQSSRQEAWAETLHAQTLPVPYYHLVFTIPSQLRPLFLRHPKFCLDALFSAASQAILSLAASKRFLRFSPGFTAVLHTWGQTLQFHPHLHVLIPAGGLSASGASFIHAPKNFFLPAKALSKVFRGLLLSLLDSAFSLEPSFKQLLSGLSFHVHLQKPLDSPSHVVRYLARYSHRTAISASRIQSFDPASGMVTFSYKDYRDGGAHKLMTLHGLEFMRRFFQHVLPKGFVRIRHYGFLAVRVKARMLARCFSLLGKAMPPLPQQKPLTIRCRVCGKALVFRELSPSLMQFYLSLGGT